MFITGQTRLFVVIGFLAGLSSACCCCWFIIMLATRDERLERASVDVDVERRAARTLEMSDAHELRARVGAKVKLFTHRLGLHVFSKINIII